MRQLTAGIGSRESELDKRLRKWMGGYETVLLGSEYFVTLCQIHASRFALSLQQNKLARKYFSHIVFEYSLE